MISRHKLGLLFGAFMGICHLVWASIVLSGIAQLLTDWIFQLHFIRPPYTIMPFSIGLAVGLVVVTSVTGYLSGWALAAIWNWLRMDTASSSFISAGSRHQPVTGH